MSILRRQEATPVTKVRDRVVETLESARHSVDEQFDEAEREIAALADRVDRRYRDLRKRANRSQDQALDHFHAVNRRLLAHPVALPMTVGALGVLAGLTVASRACGNGVRSHGNGR